MLGALFGAILSGQFAERYGRKLAHFTLCFIMGLFGFASGWAPDPYSFCVLRFFAGFAVGGCYVVYLNYLMEFLTPSWRTVCGCVSLWSFGEMLLALAGYLLPGWRHLEWATSLPAFLILLAYPWMPESPRWLLCRGRTQEALEVFNQIAKWNNRSAPAPSDIEILQRQFSLDSDSGLEKCCQSFYIFRYKQYRSQLLILIFSWFAFQLIYYGISFNMKNLSGDLYLNVFYMGVVGLPGSFVGLLFNNRFGRRKTIVGLSMATFVFLLIVIWIEEGTKLSHNYPLIIVFSCLSVRLFIAAGFAVLSCFTAESFPTIVRVSCMGICALAGNLGGILAPQLVYISTIVSSAQYVAFGLFSIAINFGAFNLREIAGLPLADFLKKDDNKVKSRARLKPYYKISDEDADHLNKKHYFVLK